MREFRRYVWSGLVVAAGLVLLSAGCAQSDSAEEPSASTASSATASGSSSGSSSAEASESGRSSDSEAERAYEDRPELRELEGDTERLRARAEIVEIKNRIQANFLMTDAQELPDDLSELTTGENPVVDDPEILRDPWGNQYIYRKNGEGDIELFSAGPDGEPGTDDDVRPSD